MKENLATIDADSIIYIATHNKKDEEVRTIDQMFSVCDSILDNILKNTNSKLYTGFLSDGKTFRDNIGILKEYKGNRNKLIKPKYYKLIKAYLYDELNFKNFYGYEADDLCIISYKLFKEHYNPIICSPDKDLRQIEGDFYDYKKEILFKVSKQESEFNLWYQVLVGDTTDHIGGCKGIGQVKANKILAEEISAQRVLKCYLETYGEYQGIINFTENYRLVKMLDTLDNFEPIINEYKREEEWVRW